MRPAARLLRLIALAALLSPLLASGCGADQSFVVSNVEAADVAAGEQVVRLAQFDRFDGSPTSLTVVLEDDPECRALSVQFCEEDAGHTLTTRPTVDGDYGCSGSPAHVADAVFAAQPSLDATVAIEPLQPG